MSVFISKLIVTQAEIKVNPLVDLLRINNMILLKKLYSAISNSNTL